jgi:hypothetical protein
MTTVLPILGELSTPGIYGKVTPKDPTVFDNTWFWVGIAAILALLALCIILFIKKSRERKWEKARHDPVYILRTRLEHLRQTTDIRGTAFFTELASIMRSAIGLRAEMSATPRTARELEQLLVGQENANRAGAALAVIKECENALFSGAQPDRDETLVRATAAFLELLPESDAKLKEGALKL